MNSLKLKAKAADAIVELHASLLHLQNYRQFPLLLESVLKKMFPVDWLAMFSFGTGAKPYNIVTNSSLPFDWNEKYATIYDFDSIRKNTLAGDIGETFIFNPTKNSFSEEMRYAFEFIKKNTDTSHFLTIHTAKTMDYDSGIGLYRADTKMPFTVEEQQLMGYLSPVLVSVTRAMMFYAEFDLKRVSVDKIRESQQALSITLNDRLIPVDIPTETSLFFRRCFPMPPNNPIPESIQHWINQTIAPAGILRPNAGPWFLKLILPDMDLYCKAYTVVSEGQQLALLILLLPHGDRMDFSVLRQGGFTSREVEALSYLPLGYTNKQIAMAMDIQEVTAKKHLKNVSQKLDTSGRVGILYEALRKRELMEFLVT
jgi:DNA-binding CsgD family transcriptional regulator